MGFRYVLELLFYHYYLFTLNVSIMLNKVMYLCTFWNKGDFLISHAANIHNIEYIEYREHD